MKRTRRQKIAMALALFIAALLVLSAAGAIVISLIPEARAVTQSEINRLKENKRRIEAEKDKLQKDLQELQSDKADAVARKVALDQQITLLNEEIDNTSLLISELTLGIAERQVELDKAVLEEEEAFQLFKTRVRVMEEAGNATYLGIIFQSASFSDLLDRWDMITEIMKTDQELMDGLAYNRERIKAAKISLETDKTDQLQFRKELSERQAELALQYAEADELIAGLMKAASIKEAEYQQEADALAQAEKDVAKAEAEMAKAEAELKKQLEAAKKNTKFVGGLFGWPVPGYEGNITSRHGYRMHPILKYRRMHTGIDIGAPKGTKIAAANAGTVIVATYSSGYGNYIVIDHGGGYTTLYAHQTKFAVGVGDQVGRGDTIGYVGSTGLSTGPHLHFEVRINGAHKDPEDYLKKN